MTISNMIPLKKSVTPMFIDNDFPDGFIITEFLSNDKIGKRVTLAGSFMPHSPLSFDAEQRIKKDYYAGYSEPTVQVLGDQESDLTIEGRINSKRMKFQSVGLVDALTGNFSLDEVEKMNQFNNSLRNLAETMKNELDGIRKRGNFVRIRIGEYMRYALISKTHFDLKRTSDISYKITFLIIGKNKPTNARYLKEQKEIPNKEVQDLLDQIAKITKAQSNIPKEVPLSISDVINEAVGAVAGVVSLVTDFVDDVISTVNDIQKSVTRIKGLIKHVQNKLRTYKNFIGSIRPFDSSQALTGQYTSSKYYNTQLRNMRELIVMLNSLKIKLSNLAPVVPVDRHFVVTGDTLQKISTKFYGSPDSWKKIYDYNHLDSTSLTIGSIIEIPKQ